MSTQPAAAKKVDGVQKVAAFLLSLDKEISAKVMRSLDPKVVSRVAEAMTDLDGGLCTPEAVDGLYVDIANTVNKRTGVRSQDDFELHEIDIESEEGLLRRLVERIPVIELDGVEVCDLFLDRDALISRLATVEG